MPSRGPNNATRSLRPESVTRKIRSLAGRGGVGIDFLLHFPKLQAAKGMGSGTALSFTCRNRMGCERRYYCESHRVASEVAFLWKAKYRCSSGLLEDVNQAVLPTGLEWKLSRRMRSEFCSEFVNQTKLLFQLRGGASIL